MLAPPYTIRSALIEALAEVQTCCGRPMCDVDDQSVPMEHLPGFKSRNAVEVAVKLATKLGHSVPPTILLTKVGGQYPTIGQVVKWLSPGTSD